MTTSVSTPPSEKVDLSIALEVITDAQEAAELLHHHPLPSRSSVDRRTREAEISRKLLNLADILDLAAGLVRNEYWKAKGQTSYDL